MPRFVVLEHQSPRGRHWDLMLEQGEALATWALDAAPDQPGPITAKALPDHRVAYLDYEGPISGGRGSVTQWDAGEYRLEKQSDAGLFVRLDGNKLTGQATLVQSPDDPDHWCFTFAPN